ncbi:hypothetical protein MKQ68_16095 [Chitinophaga horti]|uniref:WWE domain-containing protein n=1 Tax=Chitinophaga horti TaxID=2920382 RepID=A0ABY6IW66_9BACT|nr:hypothetical protein [Chitinophaga horti]UYQ91613.1 hypothetical protein MKQ68_16095 [Chitinophaga horti]
MKKLFFAASAICMLLAVNVAPTAAMTYLTKEVSVADFKKSPNGIWEGKMDGKTYWYKLDKSAKLWWSADGKKWAAVESGMWADKDGKWLKIGDGKLWWSADKGEKWAEVPEWKWEGPKGEWYKFDDKWTLWVNK